MKKVLWISRHEMTTPSYPIWSESWEEQLNYFAGRRTSAM